MEVLLVDDHPLVHEVIATIVRRTFPSCNVVYAETLQQACDAIRGGLTPQFALLDLGLADSFGINSLKRFRAEAAHIPVVVISAIEDSATISQAFEAGAVGYLPKTLKSEAIGSALQLVAAGEKYFPSQALVEAASPPAGGGLVRNKSPLTNRQLEVLQLIAKGYQNQCIAAELKISEGTVKQHVHAIFVALRVSSRTEAVAIAAQLYIEPPKLQRTV